MSRILKKVPQGSDPHRSGRKSKLLQPFKARMSEARDPVDESLQDELIRVYLRVYSDEVLSDEEIMSGAVEKGLVAVGLKVYFRIIEFWGIGEEEASVLLGTAIGR